MTESWRRTAQFHLPDDLVVPPNVWLIFFADGAPVDGQRAIKLATIPIAREVALTAIEVSFADGWEGAVLCDAEPPDYSALTTHLRAGRAMMELACARVLFVRRDVANRTPEVVA